MELARLIDALRKTSAYPAPVDAVEVHQTHISVVFLAGQHAYKIKKPVDLGFVNFSTLQLRRHYCEVEVRLNARLAPDVYRGVVPVVAQDDTLHFEGQGQAVEWAVKMRRLPDDATLESRLRRGLVTPQVIDDVARKIAGFHAQAETSERIAAFGRVDVVARNARQNFEQSVTHVGRTLSQTVFDRLAHRSTDVLAELSELVESRAARGMTRDTHGDLRLDHVYLLDEAQPAKLVIIDCIEFNEQFRFADPVSDMAFLAMDLKYEGHHDLAQRLAAAYFAASGDDEGRALLSWYTAYRAAVRGKVEGFRQAETEVPPRQREESVRRSQGYWLLALGELEPPERKPAIILVGGLPGSGKSTLAAEVGHRAGCEVIRSDVVRKELSEKPAAKSQSAPYGGGIYSEAWNDRTYAECLQRTEARLFEGARVVVDASFRQEARRRAFLEAAARWRVPAILLQCQAPVETIRRRLDARRDDASDADWAIYLRAAEAWEPLDPATAPAARIISTAGTPELAAGQALEALRAAGLVS